MKTTILSVAGIFTMLSTIDAIDPKVRDVPVSVDVFEKGNILVSTMPKSLLKLGSIKTDGDKTNNTNNISLRGIGNYMLGNGLGVGGAYNIVRSGNQVIDGVKTIQSDYNAVLGLVYGKSFKTEEGFLNIPNYTHNVYTRIYGGIAGNTYTQEFDGNTTADKDFGFTGGLEVNYLIPLNQRNDFFITPFAGINYNSLHNKEFSTTRTTLFEFNAGINATLAINTNQLSCDCKNDYGKSLNFINVDDTYIDLVTGFDFGSGKEKNEFEHNGETIEDDNKINSYDFGFYVNRTVYEDVVLGGGFSLSGEKYDELEENSYYLKQNSFKLQFTGDYYPFEEGLPGILFGRVGLGIGNEKNIVHSTFADNEYTNTLKSVQFAIGSNYAVTDRVSIISTFGYEIESLSDKQTDFKTTSGDLVYRVGLSYKL